MKSLLILRHAEAAPAAGEMFDMQRPLAERGRAQARILGQWLQQHGIHPDRTLCSAAVRAKETADIVTAAAAWTTPVLVIDALYNASGAELLAQAKRAPDDVAQLLLVAHAPGVADLVKLVTTKRADLTLLYEAATLAEVVFDLALWSEIGRGAGTLRRLLPP